MKQEHRNLNNYGGILYLNDVIELSIVPATGKTVPVSVDSRFTFTASGTANFTQYQVQVNNCNPMIQVNDGSLTANPVFEAGWVTIGNLSNSLSGTGGYFSCDSVYRFARISGANTTAIFYCFIDKLNPTIQ